MTVEIQQALQTSLSAQVKVIGLIVQKSAILNFFIGIETPAARKLKKNQSISKIIIQYKLEEKKVFSYGFYF